MFLARSELVILRLAGFNSHGFLLLNIPSTSCLTSIELCNLSKSTDFLLWQIHPVCGDVQALRISCPYIPDIGLEETIGIDFECHIDLLSAFRPRRDVSYRRLVNLVIVSTTFSFTLQHLHTN